MIASLPCTYVSARKKDEIALGIPNRQPDSQTDLVLFRYLAEQPSFLTGFQAVTKLPPPWLAGRQQKAFLSNEAFSPLQPFLPGREGAGAQPHEHNSTAAT